MLTNPYPKNLTRVNLQCRVSSSDQQYLRALTCARTGFSDKILSSLFHGFIQHLRTSGLDPDTNPSDIGYTIDHPNYARISELLAGFLRRATGFPVGNDATRDDSGTGNRMGQTPQPPEPISPNPSRDDPKGISGPGRENEKDQSNSQGLGIGSNGTAVETPIVNEMLRRLGL